MMTYPARLLFAATVLFTAVSHLQAGTTRLAPADASAGARVGAAISIDRDTMVVGAPDDNSAGPYAGSAYIYTHTGNAWHLQAKLTGPTTSGYRSFGESVAISRNVIVVGAPFEGTNGNTMGAAYVYIRTGRKWSLQAKLTAADAAANQQFGTAVAIDDDTLVVGAFLDSTGPRNAGAAYVFTRVGSKWEQRTKLTASDASPYAFFGSAVAISNSHIVVGSPTVEAAYVFAPQKNGWVQQSILTASDALEGDYSAFGASVSIDKDTLIIGAPTEGMYAVEAGAAYVFHRSGSHWIEQRKLTASDGLTEDEFGTSVAVAGNVVAIGAPFQGNANQGAVYLFETQTGQPVREFHAGAPGSAFLGASVDVSTDTVASGAPAFREFTAAPAGAAHVFSLR